MADDKKKKPQSSFFHATDKEDSSTVDAAMDMIDDMISKDNEK